jgi:hypothetical protein
LSPLVADLACVLVFAAGGKDTHEAGDSDWVILAIVWPFALAVGLAHAGLVTRGRQARRIWPEGGVVLAATYVLGMIMRGLSGRGIAVDFLVVAALFLALTMLGWRSIAQVAVDRRRR